MRHILYLFLSSLFFLAACKNNKTKHEKVPGDMQAAIRLYNDTSSVKLYIEQIEDTSLLLVSGKHWYKPSECQCEISVLLDSKPLPVKEIIINEDGSFSFYLPHFSQIMQHTLTIKQYKDSNEIKEATLSFSVLPQERKLPSGAEKKDSS